MQTGLSDSRAHGPSVGAQGQGHYDDIREPSGATSSRREREAANVTRCERVGTYEDPCCWLCESRESTWPLRQDLVGDRATLSGDVEDPGEETQFLGMLGTPYTHPWLVSSYASHAHDAQKSLLNILVL